MPVVSVVNKVDLTRVSMGMVNRGRNLSGELIEAERVDGRRRRRDLTETSIGRRNPRSGRGGGGGGVGRRLGQGWGYSFCGFERRKEGSDLEGGRRNRGCAIVLLDDIRQILIGGDGHQRVQIFRRQLTPHARRRPTHLPELHQQFCTNQ